MLDFTPVRNRTHTLQELSAALSVADLRRLTDEMVDAILALIEDCADGDVIFQPIDPNANDTFAASEAEKHIAWTLGHLVVHTTASSEESAFLAAEMARGVPNHGRSRYETPWTDVTTIRQCRSRLEESRRMRHAALDTWPDSPHLELFYEPYPGAGQINAQGRFVSGLSHDDSHLGQIAEVVRQSRQARTGA